MVDVEQPRGDFSIGLDYVHELHGVIIAIAEMQAGTQYMKDILRGADGFVFGLRGTIKL